MCQHTGQRTGVRLHCLAAAHVCTHVHTHVNAQARAAALVGGWASKLGKEERAAALESLMPLLNELVYSPVWCAAVVASARLASVERKAARKLLDELLLMVMHWGMPERQAASEQLTELLRVAAVVCATRSFWTEDSVIQTETVETPLVAVLIEQLAAPSADVALRAMWALSSGLSAGLLRDDDEVLNSTIHPLLADGDATTLRGHLSSTVDRLLADGDAKTRREAAGAAAMLGAEQLEPSLRPAVVAKLGALLVSDVDDVAVASAHALGILGADADVKELRSVRSAIAVERECALAIIRIARLVGTADGHADALLSIVARLLQPDSLCTSSVAAVDAVVASARAASLGPHWWATLSTLLWDALFAQPPPPVLSALAALLASLDRVYSRPLSNISQRWSHNHTDTAAPSLEPHSPPTMRRCAAAAERCLPVLELHGLIRAADLERPEVADSAETLELAAALYAYSSDSAAGSGVGVLEMLSSEVNSVRLKAANAVVLRLARGLAPPTELAAALTVLARTSSQDRSASDEESAERRFEVAVALCEEAAPLAGSTTAAHGSEMQEALTPVADLQEAIASRMLRTMSAALSCACSTTACACGARVLECCRADHEAVRRQIIIFIFTRQISHVFTPVWSVAKVCQPVR